MCRNQIRNVRSESGIGKLPFGMAKPGKIKAHHRNAFAVQGPRDVGNGFDVFRAGKAVRKQGICRRLAADRQIQPGRKNLAVFVFKFEFFEFHMRSSF